MSKKLSLLLAIAGCVLTNCLTSKGETTPQVKPDKMPTVIVYAVDAIEPEKKAADELNIYLTKISGGNYSLQAEDKALEGATAIYVGQTAFAKKAGIDLGTFAEEEYILRTVGPNLIIAGGGPNGSANGVHHFLSRNLGCRFFTWDCEVIPQRTDLQLPILDLRRMPSIADRGIYLPPWYFGFTPEASQKMWGFLKRNYMNPWSGPYGRLSKSKDATSCHNEFFWVDPCKYAVSNPEFYSNKGKFVNFPKERGCNQEGKLCWTNRQVWEITLAELRECIKKDRLELPRWKWPCVYQVSPNDGGGYCECGRCVDVYKAEGSKAGALLQYVNFVAESIAKEYPDVKIMTFAYVDTEDVPKNIRPASNVVIQWCDLYTRSDCYRPLTSPFNVAQKARLDGWKAIGTELAIWDYWNMGTEGEQSIYFEPPRVETMVDAIAPDIRLFASSGVKLYSAELEYDKFNPQNLVDLQIYLGLQLAADVTLPEETLIKEYLAGCYGPAAPAMEEFLTLLRQSIKNEKQALFYVTNFVRTYTDGPFLERVYRLLKKAQSAVPPGSDYARRVQQEMITPLAVILQNPQFDFFQRTGLKKEDIVAEYRAARLSRIDQPWITTERQQKDKDRMESYLAAIALDIPVPDHLRQYKSIRKFAWPQMSNGYDGTSKIEADPDSETGKALVCRKAGSELRKQKKDNESDEEHDLAKPFAGGLYPNSFGIYSSTDKRSSASIKTDVPQDEKYHWYKINAFDFGPNTSLWGFYWYAGVNLSSIYANADGLPGYNVWETWISVKYTGPAYVKDSTQKNGVFLDRVILVKPEEAKK